MCTARDGLFVGRKICLEEKYRCDNFVQCQDGKDEEGCEKTYSEKRIFQKDQSFVCKSPFLEIKNEQNETGKFFPLRAIRCGSTTIITIITMTTIMRITNLQIGAIPSCSARLVMMKRAA